VRSVLGGTAWLTLGTVASQASAAILYIFVARSAGPQAFGTVMAAIGVALVGSDVCDFGMKLWVLAVGTRAEPAEIIAQHQRKVTVALVVSVVAAALVAAVQAARGTGPDATALVPFILVGHLAVVSGASIAVRTGQARTASVLTFLERFVAAVVGLGLLAVGVSGLPALVIGLVVGEVAAIGYQSARLEHGRELLTLRLSGLRGQLRRGLPFAASDLASDVIQLHVVIVGAVAGASAAGDYAAATRLMAVFVIATGSLSTILLPALSGSGAGGAHLFRRSLWLLAGGVAAGALLVAALAPWIVELVYGPAYAAAAGAVRTYCLVVLLVSVGQPLSAALQANGRQSLVARVELAAMLPSALLVALGARQWGAAGGAVGAAVVLVPVVARYTCAWRRHTRRPGTPVPALSDPEVVR
jgi:O-antigen/teichoic acid export membrane protein